MPQALGGQLIILFQHPPLVFCCSVHVAAGCAGVINHSVGDLAAAFAVSAPSFGKRPHFGHHSHIFYPAAAVLDGGTNRMMRQAFQAASQGAPVQNTANPQATAFSFARPWFHSARVILHVVVVQ